MMPAISENISLLPFNTFRIKVKARYFIEITEEGQLIPLFKDPFLLNKQILILGGGSNVLFTKDFEGLVIKISLAGITHNINGNNIEVTAGAGIVWNTLVGYCVGNGFAGIENLSLIPGTVGASPVQNIGAYGVELKDVFLSCRAFNMDERCFEIFSAADCKFGYRESVFKTTLKDKYIITSVTFLLKGDAALNTSYGAISAELEKRGIVEPDIKDVSEVVSHIRVSKLPDPSTIGNAGSFFKNPVLDIAAFENLKAHFPEVVNYPAGAQKIKVAAGWLIEQCGFRGKIWGNTGTWKNQALVLVNHGGAKGQEVYDFSDHIISAVYKKFNVRLEREVNIF